jgi:hypothetical protein
MDFYCAERKFSVNITDTREITAWFAASMHGSLQERSKDLLHE